LLVPHSYLRQFSSSQDKTELASCGASLSGYFSIFAKVAMGNRCATHGERIEKGGLAAIVLADDQVEARLKDQLGCRVEALVVGDRKAA
jgi:hypothetical protein